MTIEQIKVGFDNFCAHHLRHSFISNLIIVNGINLTKAQQLARHKNYQTTQRYSHLTGENIPDELTEFMNIIKKRNIVIDMKSMTPKNILYPNIDKNGQLVFEIPPEDEE